LKPYHSINRKKIDLTKGEIGKFISIGVEVIN